MKEGSMNIAFLGTGLLGYPMAEKLCEAGHEVFVYNRTRARAEPLAAKGARVCSSVKEAVNPCECVILMLTDAAAIRQAMISDPAVKLSGKTVIQMGTISPTESRQLAGEVADRGGDYCECPVLGSIQEAKNKRLILMFGGSLAQWGRWKDFLLCFGPAPRRIGEAGAAAALKLALNQLIAAHICAFSLSLGLVEKSQVDRETFMDILRQSALYAPMFDKKMPKMAARDFSNPNFPVRHLLKDVNLFLSEAGRHGLGTPALEGVRRLLEQAMADGMGALDYSAVYNTVAPAETARPGGHRKRKTNG